jgi:hypothetical protein
VAREVLQREYPDIVPSGTSVNAPPGRGRETLLRASRLLMKQIALPVVLFNDLMSTGMLADTTPPEVTSEVSDWVRVVLMPHEGKTVGSIGLIIIYWERQAYVLPPRSIINQIIRSAFPGVESPSPVIEATPVAPISHKKQKTDGSLDLLAHVAAGI